MVADLVWNQSTLNGPFTIYPEWSGNSSGERSTLHPKSGGISAWPCHSIEQDMIHHISMKLNLIHVTSELEPILTNFGRDHLHVWFVNHRTRIDNHSYSTTAQFSIEWAELFLLWWKEANIRGSTSDVSVKGPFPQKGSTDGRSTSLVKSCQQVSPFCSPASFFPYGTRCGPNFFLGWQMQIVLPLNPVKYQIIRIKKPSSSSIFIRGH